MRSRQTASDRMQGTRPGWQRPVQLITALTTGLIVVLIGLATKAAPSEAIDPEVLRQWLETPSDEAGPITTASLRNQQQASTVLDTYTRLLTAVADSDSVNVDTTDSLIWTDSTGLAPRYLRALRQDRPYSFLMPRQQRPLLPKLGSYWKHEIELDSTENVFNVRELLGETAVRIPVSVDYETYRTTRLQSDLRNNWEELSEMRARQRLSRRRGGLGLSIVVPGGRQSAFTSIFGKPEVNLSVNGQANIRAGFDYKKSDQQVAFTGRATQVDPDFKQDLRLGIVGSIGDKLKVDVNWDTERDFDYQNQLKLQYTGYEDEIIQSIEAGNVNLQTPSTLIRGGQSLFGIKSELKIGGVNLTTVMSQEEGQANNLSIDGGSETIEFDLKPTDYEENTHFFLSYYFRNRWEQAYSLPSLGIVIADGFERITDVEVWKLQLLSTEDENARQIVATVDLGEPREILTQADAFTEASQQTLPNKDIDQYENVELDAILRDGDAELGSYLTEKGLGNDDFATGKFRLLTRGRDFDIDEVLGYISLRQRLQDNEAIAVAFRYLANGRTEEIGDFVASSGGSEGTQNEDRLVLKLIRPQQLRQPSPETGFNPAAWYLEMRNIYPLRGQGINPNEFDLQVFYEPPGKTAAKTLPGAGGRNTILQLLGLDRLNEDRAERPDDRFDYLVNYSIDPGAGRLIFPYLEPFGSRVEAIIDEGAGSEEEKQAVKDILVFSELYTQKKENAGRNTQLDVYRVRGSYKGAIPAFYDLRAFAGLVPGSVRVTSGGTPLQEGVDFIADYQGGTVQIINQAYLSAGRQIEIDYEQNSFFNLQKKTLIGSRLDYIYDDRFQLGSTIMRLTQKSPIDKFRIGEEPISNTIWGMDGELDIEPRWLTRAIDAIPLVQTKAESAIRLTGEFAQLRPGHSETTAFSRSRRSLQRQNRDFNSDELKGISYIDDFESFENTFSLKQPGTWRLAAAPDSISRVGPDEIGLFADSLRTTWRGTFAWYQLNQGLAGQVTLPTPPPNYDPESIRLLEINDVFPDQQTQSGLADRLSSFDMYFNPFERGPYNYTTRLNDFLANPKDVWGGITQRLPEGFNDFNLKNIEFIEFVFRPFSENPVQDANDDARLYIDLGSISEEIIPDEKLNNEDGLSTTDVSEGSILRVSRLPTGTQNNAIDVNSETRLTEDLGLDGLASYDNSAYPEFATEASKFAGFLNSLDQSNTDPRYQAEVAKALLDPSGDDYHYFGNEQYFDNRQLYPQGATLQQRFSRYFSGLELNSFEGQNRLANNTSIKRGNSRFPDSEDLNINATVDTDNSYFQYELPLNKTELDRLGQPEEVDDFVVGEIVSQDGTRTGWYQVRIPIRNFSRKVGDINDFSLIENMRIWTTGHDAPITMRFATLELVGSQWRLSDQITLERETPADTALADTRLSISSINSEEDSGIYRTPPGTVVSQTRLATGELLDSREQSMVLRVENLLPGANRAVFKTFNQGIDVLRYGHLRMFFHLHGELADGSILEDLPEDIQRDKARVFVRLGANESNDFYEYEQPLTPSSPTSGNPDDLWQTFQPNPDGEGPPVDLNSMNLQLGALNQLKFARDQRGFPTDSVFWNVLNDELIGADVPDAERFAPPGTRLAVKGNPSLTKINTIAIGIRNPADSTSMALEDELGDVTLWVNELRVSQYDETNGWAAVANADIQLADLGRVRASWQAQTDGFGSLSSTLGERDQNNIQNWSVSSDMNLDKFIPERFGWTIPVSFQVQSNTTTPRFSPDRGDVRLSEIVDQIERDTTIENSSQLVDETIENAQTHSFTRSFNTRLSKTGSKSWIARHTLDALSLNYSYTDTDARSPTQSTRDNWRWSTTANYRLTTRRPVTIKPFGPLRKIPVLGILGRLDLNLLPQSITFSGSANRSYNISQDRPTPARIDTTLPEVINFPLREQHSFTHRRSFNMSYNPFPFLGLQFDTDTNQSLNALGVDTLVNVVTLDTTYSGFNFDQALAAGLIDSTSLDQSAYEQELLRIRDFGSVVGRAINGDDLLRTERYNQGFTATLRPRFPRVPFLNWLNIQDVVYDVDYSWQNGAVGQNTGASVSNQTTIRTGASIRMQELFRKFGFYQRMENKQREADADAQQRRQDREKRRQERREERRKRREAARLAKEQADAEAQTDDTETEAGNPDDPDAPPSQEEATPDTPPERPPQREKQFPDEQRPDEPPRKRFPGEDDQPQNRPPPRRGADQGAGVNEDGRSRFAFLNPVGLFRRVVLGVTGLQDFNVTYQATRRSNSSNVGRFGQDSTNVLVNYSLIDAFRDKGPSLGYRFGLDREIPLEDRILNSRLQVTDALQDQDRIQGRATLNLTQTLKVNLTWNLDVTKQQSVSYRREFDGSVSTTNNDRGSNRATIWTFGANYLDMFEDQFATYLADFEPADTLGDTNGDGRVLLTNQSLVEDFRNAYTSGLGSLDADNLLPFPMPNWSINYSGLSNWPIFNRIAQSASLRHTYSADYSADYQTNLAATTGDSLANFNFNQQTIQFVQSDVQAGALRINERFQPLLGLDITWKGRIQTNFAWNRSNTYSLSTANAEVSENNTNEFSMTFSYQRQGLRLPFMRKALNNRISFSLTLSRAQNEDLRYLLKRALQTAAVDVEAYNPQNALEGDNVSILTASTRLSVNPQITYQFSNKVSANFFVKYDQLESEDSRLPSTTNINGGFNIRVSIQN